MEFTWKNVWFSLPMFLVELATWWNLTSYYTYHEVPFVSILLATSFSALLIGTSIFFSHDVGFVVRTLIVLGGVLLFGVQAFANISEAYLRATSLLPVDRLSPLWHIAPADLTILSAKIFGVVINVVGVIYWIALGVHFKNERRREVLAAEALRHIMSKELKGEDTHEFSSGKENEAVHR